MNDWTWMAKSNTGKAALSGPESGWPHREQLELNVNAECSCDVKGFVFAYNNRVTDLWGTPRPKSGLSCGFVRLFRPDGPAISDSQSPVAWVLASGEPVHETELTAEREDGSRRRILLDVAPLFDRQRNVLGATMSLRDITQMRERAEAGYQIMLLEALRRLSGEVAHDFCNVLAPVLHHLERTEEIGAPHAVATLNGVRESVRRGQELTNRLFEFAETSRPFREECDVNALIRALSEALLNKGDGAPSLVLHLYSHLWPVFVDGTHFEKAILHLVANAQEAMPHDGVTTIETANVELTARDGYLAPGKYVLISVRDIGSGMPEETRAQAFEPLFTTKGGGKHAGMGLSVVLGMARQHGGDVQIRSQISQGTEVQIYLPCLDTGGYAINGAIKSRPAKQPRLAPILVVDDDADFRMTMVDAFGSLGIEVMDAPSGTSALEVLRSDRPVDLLIVDDGLGRVNGGEILRQARILRPGLKVLLIAGRTNIPRARMRSGADVDVLTKPFGMAEFMDRLNRIVPHLIAETA